jgi:hypothetical protein
MLGTLLWALAVSLGAIDSTMKGLLFLRATCVSAIRHYAVSLQDIRAAAHAPVVRSAAASTLYAFMCFKQALYLSLRFMRLASEHTSGDLPASG